MRGDGRIFLRGNVWYADYSPRGHRLRTSTGIEGDAKGKGRREANDWLKQRQSELAQGIVTARADKITVAELVQDLFTHYKLVGHKSNDAHRWTKHLSPFFNKCRAMSVSPSLLKQYIAERKTQVNRWNEEPSNGTLNRELALLRAAYNLAKKEDRLRHVPYFPMLPENNVREGFLKDEDYDKLADAAAKVGLWMRTLLAIYHNFGWRKSEAAKHLRVSQVDLSNRTILLSRYNVKNKKPKRLRMSHEVFGLLSACVAGKVPDDLAITRGKGRPVGDFRKSWHSLCISVGLGKMLCRACGKVATKSKCECGSKHLKYQGLTVHDLRRTGVRNLRRLGFAEKTIMEISGHRTASVFRRYDIVDETDLAQVAAALDAKRAEALRHKSGTNEPVPDSSGSNPEQQDAKIQ